MLLVRPPTATTTNSNMGIFVNPGLFAKRTPDRIRKI
jgi:hypothetical protein